MAYATTFRRLLDEAVKRRTQGLMRLLVPGRGAPKKFSKRIRDRLRAKLLVIVSVILVREHARKELRKLVVQRRLRYIKGYGIDDRFERLFGWAEEKLRRPIVYAFWNGRKCLYVGKGKNYRRLNAYKKSIYWKDADCLKVWQVRSKSRLPSAECLVIHLLGPRDNKAKAAKVKWGTRCLVCARHDEIKIELDSLLRLRA